MKKSTACIPFVEASVVSPVSIVRITFC